MHRARASQRGDAAPCFYWFGFQLAQTLQMQRDVLPRTLSATLLRTGGALQNQPVVQLKKEYQPWLMVRVGVAQGRLSRRLWKP